MADHDFISIAEAARLLKVSITTLRRWDETGELTSTRGDKGTHRRYKKEDLLDFLSARSDEETPWEKNNSFVFDFDSTLVTVESLEEVIALTVRKKTPSERKAIMQQVQWITDMGMNGELNFSESLQQRLKIAPPSLKELTVFKQSILTKITPGIPQVIRFLQEQKQSIFVLSGFFQDCLLPVTRKLGITDTCVLGNECFLNQQGAFCGIDTQNPLAHGNGKTEIIRGLKEAGLLPGKICMIGDGATDLAPYLDHEVELFIGFGANQSRKKVWAKAPQYVSSSSQLLTYLTSLLSRT
jgi:D-3-phosphoglycerate dehydrogenase